MKQKRPELSNLCGSIYLYEIFCASIIAPFTLICLSILTFDFIIIHKDVSIDKSLERSKT